MPIIQFTPAECTAMLHRLETDCIASAIADTEGLEHLADLAQPEIDDIVRQIKSGGAVDVDDTAMPSLSQQARREALADAIEGSTWAAVRDNHEFSIGARTAAARTLRSCASKVEAALGLAAGSIDAPTA